MEYNKTFQNFEFESMYEQKIKRGVSSVDKINNIKIRLCFNGKIQLSFLI